jgi:hypothetical protein
MALGRNPSVLYAWKVFGVTLEAGRELWQWNAVQKKVTPQNIAESGFKPQGNAQGCYDSSIREGLCATSRMSVTLHGHLIAEAQAPGLVSIL